MIHKLELVAPDHMSAEPRLEQVMASLVIAMNIVKDLSSECPWELKEGRQPLESGSH